MSSLSKVAVVLGPISVAWDITSLVFEYKKENTSVDFCKTVLVQLEAIKSDLKKRNTVLRNEKSHLTERHYKAKLFEEELRRIEAKRIEEEREEQRWRECMEIKFVHFCILYFCKFMGLINF